MQQCNFSAFQYSSSGTFKTGHSGNMVSQESAKYEENSSGQTAAGPEVIPAKRCSHVKKRKRYKNRKGDDFLNNFQLGQIEPAVSAAIGRHLDKILKKGDSP